MRFGYRLLYLLLIIVHVLLVLMHVGLLSVWALHAEQAVIVPLDQAGEVSTQVIFALQVFIILYTALLLLITQRLSINSLVDRPKTLTAVHDISNAWTGLGSALFSLGRQFSIPAAVFGTLGVTVYLASLSVLHISTPSLFTMDTYNQTGALSVGLTAGMPNITNATMLGYDRGGALWAITSTMLPYLIFVNNQSTLGLANGTLYDILDPNIGTGNVTVNATTASVACHTVPNAAAVLTYASDEEYIWTVHAIYNDYNITFDLVGILASTGVIKQFTWYNEAENSTLLLGRNAIFITTFGVVDSKGNTGSYISGYNYSDLQIIGCTLSWNSTKVIVDSSTRFIVAMESGVANNRSSEWSVWSPGLQSFPQDRQNLELDMWADMLSSSTSGMFAIGNTSPNSTSSSEIVGTQTEQSVKLILPASIDGGNVTLTQFENAVGEMTADVFWAGTHVLPADVCPNCLTLARGSTGVPKTVSRLNLNLTAILFGLVSSIILLIIAVFLTFGVTKTNRMIDGMGVLQFLWLVSDRATIQKRLAGIDEPTTGELRKVGMSETVSIRDKTARAESIEMEYSTLGTKDYD
ncbi:uncharacterized protein LAESUDRAFT_813682 [Laetiporus sulphureus 93-53]|uniref:Uncharacterized protein n=1 Tax=Laetiporus sulphureus 93-53 TaxID=1314785 RepID=A0A165DJU6_9APHY|nr:uncharacterized protein LAESUDRAFT_813682 [Laetiporus sulphureus 93-53]KZT05042.1 hypothetical protein LAESUDRAFT_813682 [Laetiporus sulphureus 93-53]